VLQGHAEPTEPSVARQLVTALPDGATLVIGSSMPIRDVEWYSAPKADLRMVSNRGANGIDGLVSTALGVALSGAVTAALVGDISFLHDSSALIGIVERDVNLTIVVVDNDGGGIFSFLPQATKLSSDRFEQLFGTPHGVRPEGLAAAHGMAAATVDEAAGLPAAVGDAVNAGGVRLVVVRTDRATNVKVHDELHAAVATALSLSVPRPRRPK
jgi:2-succinyl-5-enolpyruvyl-6-hydroxy-3-cyclohexene-1-carboxylate synthase